MANRVGASRFLALMLVLLLLTTFIFCGMTCALHITHHCCEAAECRVCDLLHNADAIVKQLGLVLLPAWIALTASALLPLLACALPAPKARAHSLVCLKVRMNH